MIHNVFNKHKKEAAATLIFVTVLIMLLIVKMPVSQAVVQIQFDQFYENREVKIHYTPKGSSQENVITETTGSNQVASFINEEYYQLDSLEIEYDSESQDDAINQMLFSFRGKVNGEIKENEIYEGAEVQYNTGVASVKLSETGLSEYNKIFTDDWRLKVELGSIFLAVYVFFLLRHLPMAYWRRFGGKGLFIFVAVTLYCVVSLISFKELNHSASRQNLYIKSSKVSDKLEVDEKYKQSFTGKEDIQGVSVKCGTYGANLTGNYVFRLYQGEEQQPILTKTVSGSILKDNAFHDIYFDEIDIQEGQTYYFSITSEQYYDGESLSLYMGDGDIYQGGQVYVDGSSVNEDIVFQTLGAGPNRFLIVWGCFTMFYFCILLVLVWKSYHIKKTTVIRIIYMFAALFALVKLGTYLKHFDVSIYDELAQISYVAYMEEHPEVIIPDFSDVHLLMPYNDEKQEEVYNNLKALTLNKDGEYVGKDSGIINYLGHPPFYYHLMKLADAVDVQGDEIIIDVVKLRVFNIGLVMAALCLMFYIGYTRIKKNPVVHLVFTSTILAMHAMFYVGASVNNDNLTLLGVTIFILGALRYVEKKYTTGTYFIVSLGLILSLWAKMTAGLMCVVAAIVLVSLTFYKEKSAKSLFNKRFWLSLPIYLLGGSYFIYLLIVEGTVQPSLASFAGHQYKLAAMVYTSPENRTVHSLLGFLRQFFIHFLSAWTDGIPGTVGGLFSISRIGNWIITILPFALFSRKHRGKTEGRERMYFSLFVGILFTVILQFLRGYRDFQFVSGHASTQSRYYLCMALFFGLTAAYFLEKLCEKKENIVKLQLGNFRICLTGENVAVLLGGILSAILFYSGFISSIVHTMLYPF